MNIGYKLESKIWNFISLGKGIENEIIRSKVLNVQSFMIVHAVPLEDFSF